MTIDVRAPRTPGEHVLDTGRIMIEHRVHPLVLSIATAAGIISTAHGGDAGWATAFAPAGPDDAVHADLEDGNVVIGGAFTHIGARAFAHVAVHTDGEWLPLGSGTDDAVNALVTYGDEVVGGGILALGPISELTRVARYDGVSWSALPEQPPGIVTALTVQNDALVAAGNFRTIDDGSVGVDVYEDDTWTYLDLDRFAGSFEVLCSQGDALIAGGSVVLDGAICLAARREDGVWSCEIEATPPPGDPAKLRVLLLDDERTIAAGHFDALDGAPAANLAVRGTAREPVASPSAETAVSRRGDDWRPLGSIESQALDSAAHTTVVHGGSLIVAGEFTAAGLEPLAGIGAWDGVSWTPLGSGMDGTVNALCSAGDLIAGGSFDTAGGIPAPGVARWSNGAWTAMESLAGTVDALHVHDATLYAGGTFTIAGASALRHLARWDGTRWHDVGLELDGPVTALFSHGADLVLGGSFVTGHHGRLGGIARYDGVTAEPMGSGLDGFLITPTIHGGTVYGGRLIVGGLFDRIDDVEASGLAAWSDTGRSPVDPMFSGTVRTLMRTEDRLLVAGSFVAPVEDAASLAAWDGTSWHAVGGGVRHGPGRAGPGERVYRNRVERQPRRRRPTFPRGTDTVARPRDPLRRGSGSIDTDLARRRVGGAASGGRIGARAAHHAIPRRPGRLASRCPRAPRPHVGPRRTRPRAARDRVRWKRCAGAPRSVGGLLPAADAGNGSGANAVDSLSSSVVPSPVAFSARDLLSTRSPAFSVPVPVNKIHQSEPTPGGGARHVVLVRGINAGKAKRVPMRFLAAETTPAGCGSYARTKGSPTPCDSRTPS